MDGHLERHDRINGIHRRRIVLVLIIFPIVIIGGKMRARIFGAAISPLR